MGQASNNHVEIVEVEEVIDARGLQILQQDRASMMTQIDIAKRYPRDLKKCIDNIVTIVSLDLETAEKCTFTLKKGGKVIAGPSVGLARIIAQELGNMRVENRVIGFDSTHVTCEAICFDLEKNYAVRTQIKKSIVGNSGVFSEDMKVITANAANAIALRNAVFAVVSKPVIDKAYKSAKSIITGDVSDEQKLTVKRNNVFEKLKQIYSDKKLTDAEICSSVGKQAVNHITPDDIVAIVGYEKAISQGEMLFENVFRADRSPKNPTPENKENVEKERLKALIEKTEKIEDLEKLKQHCKTTEMKSVFDKQYQKLKNPQKEKAEPVKK